jgi:hypothetical protein
MFSNLILRLYFTNVHFRYCDKERERLERDSLGSESVEPPGFVSLIIRDCRFVGGTGCWFLSSLSPSLDSRSGLQHESN